MRLIVADLYRMACAKAWWLALFLPALAGAARVLFSSVSSQVDVARRVATGEGGADEQVLENGFGPLADGLRTGGAVLALIALVLGAQLWVRERENGAIATLFLSRRRTVVLGAKACVLAIFVVLCLGLLIGATTVCVDRFFDLGPVVEDGFEMATEAELWSNVGWALLGSIPALLAAACFGLLVSTWTSSGAAAVTSTLVPFVVFDLFQGMLGEVSRLAFVRYVPFLGEHSAMARLTDVARAYSDAGWESGELMQLSLVPGAQALLFVALACVSVKVRSA